MAVAFRASALGGTDPTTSTTATIPATTAANDIVLAFITNRGATADPAVSDDEGAGAWAKVTNQLANTNGAGSIWWKRASADTNGKTLTVSGLTDSCSLVVQAFSGCVTSGNPYRHVRGSANASGTEAADLGIFPSSQGGSMALAAVFNTGNDNAVTSLSFAGAGALTNTAEHLSAGGDDCGVIAGSIAPSGVFLTTGALTWAQVNGTTASVVLLLIAAENADALPIVAFFGLGALGATTTAPSWIPDVVLTDDLLFYFVTNRGATTDPTVVDDDAGGNAWAKVGNQNANTNGAGTVWWKRATSGTAGKIVTASGLTGSTSGVGIVVRGGSTDATPYEGVTSEGNASGDETQVGFTPSVNGVRLLFGVFNTSNDTLAVATMACTDPGAMAYQARSTSTGGSDCSVDLGTVMQATAGATGNFTWAQTNGVTASIAFAVLPVTAAGTTVIPVSASAGHTVAAGALAQTNLLVSVSPLAGHTVAAGGLAQLNTLVSVSGTQGHSVVAPALTRVLIAVAALQGHTVAAGGLAQANSLLGVSATQGHEVAAPGFTIAGVTLIPVDVIAGHLVAAPALSQTAILQMATATQGHTVASPALAQTNLLISVSPTAGHTVAASALLQQNIQRVANAIAGHIADPGSFSTTTVITVVDAITGHTAQVGVVQLFAIGQSSPSRIYAVLEDGRTYLVLPRNETIH